MILIITIMVHTKSKSTTDPEKDLPVCIGELAELTLELTRYLRGKMNRDNFLQELSHVQWAVWSLQHPPFRRASNSGPLRGLITPHLKWGLRAAQSAGNL